MISRLILDLYKNYLKSCEIIDCLKKAESNQMKRKRYRKPNFPEQISEYISYLLISKEKNINRYTTTGDLEMIENGVTKRIEIKCFSSSGPISFGPSENWDKIYFLNAINHPKIIMYECNLSNTSREWLNIKMNKRETFEDQIRQKRRPRITFNSLSTQIKYDCIIECDIIDLLSKHKEITEMSKMSETKKTKELKTTNNKQIKETKTVDVPETEMSKMSETKKTKELKTTNKKQIKEMKERRKTKTVDVLETKKLRIADFFAGIGGIRLGFELASDTFECVFSNEIDKKAIITYEENFPSHRVNDTDITLLDTNEIPNFDILLAGFPCQSFSIAGNRKGFEDERGNLFFQLVRIMKEKKPSIFVLENVKNLVTHNEGKTFETISTELANLGYSFKYKVLNSSEYGAVPQNRERVFIVGFLDKEKCEKFSFPKKLVLKKNLTDFLEDEEIKEIKEKYYYHENCKIYPKLEEVCVEKDVVYQYRRSYVRTTTTGLCPTLLSNMGSGGHNIPIIVDDNGIRKLTPRECFNLQSFPPTYKLPEIADSHLYKQIGNSVTVKVVQRIAKQLLDIL